MAEAGVPVVMRSLMEALREERPTGAQDGWTAGETAACRQI
jgi:hypothetical protein